MASLKQILPALFIGLVFLAATFTETLARTSLVTLPMRDQVIVNMANPDATLVEETRTLTLQEGVNRIDFSWQGVRIDTDSIGLTVLSHPDQVTVLSVSFPPEGSALTWDVFSKSALQVKARIHYLLSGIDRLVTYKAVTDPDETRFDLESFLVLRNFSGEDFDDAGFVLNSGRPFTSATRHQETKRILFFQKDSIPVTKTLVWDAAHMPHEPDKLDYTVGIPVSYSFSNDAKTGLGSHMMSPGKTRVFQDDGQDSTIFLGEDQLELTPVGEKIDLRLSDSRDISVARHRMDTRRLNMKKNTKGSLQMYDEQVRDRLTIRNFKDKPVTLKIIEHIEGQWEPVDINAEYTLKDSGTLEFMVGLKPGEKREIIMIYRVKNIFAVRFNRFNRVNPI